jgi:hypothetical protein
MHFSQQWVKNENVLEFSVLGAGIIELYCDRKSPVAFGNE